MYDAVYIMCSLLNETACYVGKELGFSYNKEEAKASFDFFNYVRDLPKDAKEIY